MDLPDVLSAAFLVAVALVSLLSNALVLLCFLHSTEIRRQVPGVFVMNLSLCNILIALLNMPATTAGIIRRQQPFGDRWCSTVSFMDTFLTANAMLSTAALSIDRWIAVVFPLSYSSKMRYKDAAVMVCYSWMHSFTFSLTALLFSWLRYSDAFASCILQRGGGDRLKFAVFTAVFHAGSFALSLLTLCVTYLKVLQVARFHCKRIDVITMQTLFLLVDVHPKLVELLPFVDVNRRWGIISKCLTYSKAASDPFAYSLLRQQYKKVALRVFNRLLRRNLPSSDHNSSLDTESDYCLQRVS
ncbi:G-protein coupled receptor 26-like isoform X2 [Nerophis lumbriciformis]|uniref:G-protein coupled receptor 26-like isoform X2 n=1 Tax=Nerophis lumbriciformis TaxID=546530 RepID=UPI003BA84C00